MTRRTVRAIVLCAAAVAGIGIMLLWGSSQGSNEGMDEEVRVFASEHVVERPAIDVSQRETVLSDGNGIQSIPSEWITDPEFSTQEEKELYDQKWHTNKEQRALYGLKEVTTDSGSQYIAGELLVEMRFETSDEEVQSIATALGGRVAEVKDSELFDERSVSLYFNDCTDMEAMADKARELPGVKTADVIGVVRALELESSELAAAGMFPDPDAVYQTYLTYGHFREAWKEARCSGGVTVAVLDSGIDFVHEDLIDNIDADSAYDAIEDDYMDDTIPDLYGHGTAVAGVLAASANNGKGLAGGSYDARILPIRVLNVSGSGDPRDVVDAFDHILLMDDKPAVINMSFGSLSYDSNLQERIDLAVDRYGIVCVASVGNDSALNDGIDIDPVRYPAGCEGVIGVGSVTTTGSHSAFSNTNASVDICAFGEGIYTTTDPLSVFGQGNLYANQYAGMGADGAMKELSIAGTSFSSPQVAAAAALVKAKYSDMKPTNVEALLFSSATAASVSSGVTDVFLFGSGILNISAALGAQESETQENISMDAQITGNHITGAATRGAAPALEILGVDSVEESG